MHTLREQTKSSDPTEFIFDLLRLSSHRMVSKLMIQVTSIHHLLDC